MSGSANTLRPGSIFGQYRILRLLGTGGMGVVYEVEHEITGKNHALKLLSEEVMEVPGALVRFKREAEVMSRLKHPGIVRVDDSGETDGCHWLRMELMPGREEAGQTVVTLEDYLALKGGRLSEEEVDTVFADILDALEHAHEKGFIHRDLKPANILFSGDHPKISDFGLVEAVGGAEWMDTQVRTTMINPNKEATLIDDGSGTGAASRARALMGTYAYMSPEQKACRKADTRSDLYAVGLMIREAITGEKSLGMEKPSEMVSDIRSEWDDWVRQAVANDMDRRFQSALEMKEAMSYRETVAPPVDQIKGGRVWRYLTAAALLVGLFAWSPWDEEVSESEAQGDELVSASVSPEEDTSPSPVPDVSQRAPVQKGSKPDELPASEFVPPKKREGSLVLELDDSFFSQGPKIYLDHEEITDFEIEKKKDKVEVDLGFFPSENYYALRITHPQYVEYERRVLIEDNKTAGIRLPKFQPLPGFLLVSCAQPGVSIKLFEDSDPQHSRPALSEQIVGSSEFPLKFEVPSKKKLLVVCSLSGYRDWDHNVTLEPNDKMTLKVPKLVQQAGWIRVTGDPSVLNDSRTKFLFNGSDLSGEYIRSDQSKGTGKSAKTLGPLRMGSYELRIKHPEYEEQASEKDFFIRDNKTVEIQLPKFQPLPGFLLVYCAQPGVSIKLFEDSDPQRSRPALREQIVGAINIPLEFEVPSKKKLLVVCSLSGYRAWEHIVTLKPNDKMTLKVPELVQQTGWIRVTGDPSVLNDPRTKFLFNGSDLSGEYIRSDQSKGTGKSAKTLGPLRMGSYELRITHPEYEDYSNWKVSIEDNKTSQIPVVMTMKPPSLSAKLLVEALKEKGAEKVELVGKKISDLSPFAKLAKDTIHLDLSGNEIIDVSALAGLRKLEWLDLSGNMINDVRPLEALTRLKHLDLGSNLIDDVSPLGALPKLEYLDLRSNYIQIVSVLKHLPKLNHLILYDQKATGKVRRELNRGGRELVIVDDERFIVTGMRDGKVNVEFDPPKP